jgi:hypothetical protein
MTWGSNMEDHTSNDAGNDTGSPASASDGAPATEVPMLPVAVFLAATVIAIALGVKFCAASADATRTAGGAPPAPEDPSFEGHGDGVGPVIDAELVEDMQQMALHRCFTDMQLPGDVPVA